MTTNTLYHKVRLTVRRADHMGMCFGVRDAIALAKREAAMAPLTVLGELVHNATVLRELSRSGVNFENQPEHVQTASAMITAHGTSDGARARAESAGLQLHDATCPLVHQAHRQLQGLVAQGYHPVVIGRANHVEVRGMTDDLNVVDVVLSEQEVRRMAVRQRFGVVAQTTQPIARVRLLVGQIRQTFPEAEVKFVDTVCQPTKQRQSAAESLSRQSDVVFVVGGVNSNNTKELTRTCGRYCEAVYHVQGPEDIRAEWLPWGGVAGLTAGTSTPDTLIDAVEQRLIELSARSEKEVA